MKKRNFLFLIITSIFTISLLFAGTKKGKHKKNDDFLRAKPYIQNEELRSELKTLRTEFEIEEKKISANYRKQIETLKIARKDEMKSLKNDFASRRDILFKKYPPKKRKKTMLDLNNKKPDKVKSEKKKTPIIRKK